MPRQVRTYVAAGTFMEAVDYFKGDLGAEGAKLLGQCAQKAKYATWRATIINKALRDGVPIPLPEGAEPEPAVGGVDPFGAPLAFQPAPAALPPAPAPMAVAPAHLPPVPAPQPAPQPAAPAASAGGGGAAVGRAEMADAQKHASWAVSALQFKDPATARKELLIALQILGGP